MILRDEKRLREWFSIPRESGDDPRGATKQRSTNGYSPRERG